MELGFVDSGQQADFKSIGREKVKMKVDDDGRNPTGHNKMLLQ
jgi:hypothetical protein